MENDVMNEEQGKELREELTLPIIILVVLFFVWFLCLYQHESWLVVFKHLWFWLMNPVVYYTPIQVKGVLVASIATIQIIVLGTVASHALLVGKGDKLIKRISSIGLGFGFTGLVTILLAVFGMLYKTPLNAIILLLIIVLVLRGSLRKESKHSLQSVGIFFRDAFSIWIFRKPTSVKSCVHAWLPLVFPISLIFFLIYYQALFAPIIHWDATVYHAVTPSIMYLHHGIPLIAGTSHGLEISLNYPPLFYALGAYYYTQVGGVEELYLKAISPTMALLTILAVFRIGKMIGGVTCGKISSLLLSVTPLFILYSMYVTNYMTLVFFITTSILFMLLAFTKNGSEYWMACGVFYGFSLLSNYQALFLLPLFLGVLFYLFLKGKIDYLSSLKCFMPTLVIAGIWYLRNMILLENPIFPFFYTLLGGKYVDPTMRNIVMESIWECSVLSYFNKYNPSTVECLGTFIFDFQHFPAFSLLTLISIILALCQSPHIRNWVLLIWALLPCLTPLSGVQWIFPRAFLITIPPFALFTALPISEALNLLGHRALFHKSLLATLRRYWKEYLAKFFIGITLLMILLFPGLTIAITGKATYDAPFVEPPSDPLFYIKNLGTIPKWYHGVDVKVWEFLNSHLRDGERVATFESKLYYIKGGDYDYFFPLDGWRARELYKIRDPMEILQFLEKNNVRYIFDSPWTRGALWDLLPLKSFLGSPWFPKIFDPTPTTLMGDEGGTIYKVGPVPTSLTDSSLTLISINQQGWMSHEIGNKTYMSIIADKYAPLLSDAPRIYVATPSLTLVKITYLDEGTGQLSIHLYNPHTRTWIHDYATIMKRDTNKWKTYEFLAPICERGFVEFGLHAYYENFTTSKIEAVPLQLPGKVSIYSLEWEITNMTTPPTLMVYLPILGGGEKFTVQTDSYGKNISVEIFEGYIQPREVDKWWERHKMVARAPTLPTFNQEDPVLTWEAKAGIYTLVITSWDEYEPDTKIDFSIAIGGGR